MTVEDWEGSREETVIVDDYVVVAAGNKYVDGITTYPGTGTTVITVKVKR